MTTENLLSHPVIDTEAEAAAEAEFAMRFTSTPRGARLARRLVARRLDEWGHPGGSRVHDDVTLIAAELAANAVRHGHVQGREFALRLTATADAVRVEVTDTRGECRPEPGTLPPPDAERGRGLYLVSQLADRWAIGPARQEGWGPGKTVWAQVSKGEPAPRPAPGGARHDVSRA